MRLTAGELAALAGGEVAGDAEAIVETFTCDSRAVEGDACFVAVHAHRDGHDFVEDAFARGARVALVSRPPHRAPAPGRAVVRVPDTVRALQEAARALRAARPDLVVVGITGSTGKTSTKDLLRAALARHREVHANEQSFNNELGLPLTVLGITPGTQVLVTEMGARAPGNIEELCRIAAPTVGVVTNIGLAHAEHLGGPDGVAAVKGELLEALPASGLAVLDADDRQTPALAARTEAEVVTVGGAGADVRIGPVTLDETMCASFEVAGRRIELALPGVHQARNAALAAVVAHRLGLGWDDIADSLREARGSRWRMELTYADDGVAVLNDAYNANPSSMDAALRSFAHLAVPGRRIAVLGDMRELGEHGDGAHDEVGATAAATGLDVLVGVGEGGARIAATARAAGLPDVRVVEDAAGALGSLAAEVRPGDAVLVKASRAVGLEVVAEGLLTGRPAPREGARS